MSALLDLWSFLRNNARSVREQPVDVYLSKLAETEPRLFSVFHQLDRQQHFDETALAVHLYGEGATPCTNAFKKIKQRAVDEMTALILTGNFDFSKRSAIARGYFVAHRYYVAGSLLNMVGAHSGSDFLFRKALAKARKYGATQVKMMCYDNLAYNAGMLQRNRRKYNIYRAGFLKAKEEITAESMARDHLIRLALIDGISPQARASRHRIAHQAIKDLEEQYDYHSLDHRYAFPYFALKLECWSAASDYGRVLEVIDEALAYLDARKVAHPVAKANFLLHKLAVFSVRKEFQKGAEAYKKCLSLVGSNSLTNVKLQELMLLLALRSQHYREAIDIYLALSSSKFFNDLPEHIKERWQLLRAYLYYLKYTGHLAAKDLSNDPLGKWRLGKFLNQVVKQSYDKSGYNVSILIIKLLFSIQVAPGAIDDHVQAINRYSTRYLQQDANYRSKCFIRLILLLPTYDFSSVKAEKRAATWLRKLAKTPIEYSNQSFELEIIPYEDLFQIALANLNKRE